MTTAVIIPFPNKHERLLRELERNVGRLRPVAYEPPSDRGITVDIAFMGVTVDEYYGETVK
jgi:hypothetical protein